MSNTEAWETIVTTPNAEDENWREKRHITPFIGKTTTVDRVIEGAKAEVLEMKAELAPYDRKVVTEALLDVGGIAMSTRKVYKLGPVDGLLVHVPAKDVWFFIDVLRDLLVEGPTNVAGCFTIDAWPKPILADEPFIKLLIKALEEVLPEAKAHASAEAAAFNAKFVDAPHPNVQVKPRGPLPDADA